MSRRRRTLPVTTWSEADIAAMIELAGRGWTGRRIAIYLGRKHTAVQCWLLRHGVHEHRRRMRESIAAALLAMPDLNNRQIGELLGCSPDLVATVRGPRHCQTRVERFCSSLAWLNEPSGRIKAARQAEGIEP